MKVGSLKRFKLPDAPGIYVFRDSKKRPLYIGRATSLKDRVRSYFANDLIDTRGPRIVDMVTRAKGLTWIETGSVLEAVLLESEYIKKYQPYYNVDERDDKSLQYVVISDEPWPRVFLERARDLEKKLSEPGPKGQGSLPYKILRKFGPYPQVGLIKEAMKILRKLFPFRDKKSSDPRHEAFYRALGRSPEETGEESRAKYVETIKYLIMFFEGKRKKLRKELEREMKECAEDMNFEKAGEAKRLIYALEHINDLALIKRESRVGENGRAFRMEAYDVAHLSGMETVGVMVVSINGQLAPSEYRKFKISKDGNNDAAGLKEVLSRRLNHPEWQYPDLIVVDGNIIQSNTAESVLQARRITIPIVAVTKNERHKAESISGNQEIVSEYKNEIIAINAESHRFAIGYHRKRRSMRERSMRKL